MIGGQVAVRPKINTLLFCLVPVISAVGLDACRVIRAAKPWPDKASWGQHPGGGRSQVLSPLPAGTRHHYLMYT